MTGILVLTIQSRGAGHIDIGMRRVLLSLGRIRSIYGLVIHSAQADRRIRGQDLFARGVRKRPHMGGRRGMSHRTHHVGLLAALV